MTDQGELGSQRNEETRNRPIKTAKAFEAEAVRWLMGDERGRAFVWGQLGRAGLFRSSMAASAELTAFNEGRRDMGLTLLADVTRLCPDQYTRMQAEAAARATPKKEEPSDG